MTHYRTRAGRWVEAALVVCACALLAADMTQGQAPPPPPGTERVLSFARHGNQVAVCAEKKGDPILKAGRRMAPTEVWYMNGRVVRKTALGEGVCDPAWSPDGRRLAVTAPDGIWVLSDVFLDQQDSGERVVDAQRAEGGSGKSISLGFTNPSWSPDGARLAYVASQGTTAWIEVIDLASQRQLLKSEPGAITYTWSPDSRSLQVGGKALRVP